MHAEPPPQQGPANTAGHATLPQLPLSLYHDLYALAKREMRHERDSHSLQPTALLNEAWLRLAQQRNLTLNRRTRFLAAAANTMRRVLVDHARHKLRQKRGGENHRRVALHSLTIQVERERARNSLDVLAIDEALSRLAVLHARAARVVELRFFGGLTHPQIVDELGISPRTVSNDWQFAKAWLYRELAVDD